MALVDTLKTARTNMAARLEEVTRNPKPNYEIDGETVEWADYVEMLTNGIDKLSKLIAARDSTGGFHQTQGFT